MWKKVLYFGITIIIGFMVYIISYNSNQMNHLESLVKQAIASEKFYEVPMVWDGCFDTKSIIDNNSENMDIVLYPATSQTDISYGSEENTSRFVKYERAYYLYMFNTKFSLESVKTASDTSYNLSGIEFSNGEKKYNYYFIVDENINSGSYIASPATKEDVLLKGSRDVTNTNSIWNFMRVTFTETMLNQISKELDGNIEKIAITDSEGKAQYTSAVDLSFSQAFFKDVQALFDNYNTYLDSYVAADGDKTKINEAQEKFNEFYTPWYEDFNSKKEETQYTFRYDNDVLTPSKLTWQSIGILALYVLVVGIIFVLLFHFKSIRRLFSRDNYKKYSSDSKVLVNGKWVDRSKAKSGMKPVSTKTVDVIEPDTKADETLETVTAGAIVADLNKEEQPIEEKSLEKTEEPANLDSLEPSKEETEVSSQIEESVQEPIQEEVKTEAPKKTPVKKTPAKKVEPKKEEAPKKTPAKKTTSATEKTSSSKTSAVKKTPAKPKEKKDEAN